MHSAIDPTLNLNRAPPLIFRSRAGLWLNLKHYTMHNRRNFYRILHVDRDAPPAIITASYRSLLSTLRLHPDLGGDHEGAVLINQAYAVLRDPVKRAQYDLALPPRRAQRRPAPPAPISAVAAKRCPFCHAPSTAATARTPRCVTCDSPLTPVSRASGNTELFGRRALPRLPKAAQLMIYPQWPHAGVPATLRDLSPAGISLVTLLATRPGQVLKIASAVIAGIAQIVSSDPERDGFAVRALLLSAEFQLKAGSFVATRV